MILAPAGPRLAARIGLNRTISLGMGLAALGMLLFSFVTSGTPYVVLLVPMIIDVGGHGAVDAVAHRLHHVGRAARARPASGSAMNDVTRELGGALGVAVLGSLVASRYDSLDLRRDLQPSRRGPRRRRRQPVGRARGRRSASVGPRASASSTPPRTPTSSGMNMATLVGAIVAAIGAVIVYRKLPSTRPHGTAPAAAPSPARSARSPRSPRSIDGSGRPGRRPPVPSAAMIDVRRLRSDPAGVRAAMARRAQPELLRPARRRPRARSRAARPDGAARRPAPPGQRAVEAGRAGCGRAATPPPPRRPWPRAGASGDVEADVARQADDVEQRPARRPAAHPQHPGAPTPPTASPSTTTSWWPPWATTPERYGDAPAGAALGHRHRPRHPRQRAGGEDLGLDVHDAAGPRRHA